MNTNNYQYGCPEGKWRGQLDGKEWGKKANIRLYFTDLESGDKYWFSTFFNNNYQPKEGGLNFAREVEINQCFELTTQKTKNGTPKLVKAVLITT